MRPTRARASRPAKPPGPPTPNAGRVTGTAGLLALSTFVLGVLASNRPDIPDQPALGAFLDTGGTRLFIAWLITTVAGLAWLCFILGMRALLPPGFGRDLFTLAAVAGQTATWIGSALDTATAPRVAHDVPLSVYTAFGEAGHLAGATGIAATGLALTALASAMRTQPTHWPRLLPGLTTAAGILLILTGPIGPASLPILVLWTGLVCVVTLRLPTSTNAGQMH